MPGQKELLRFLKEQDNGVTNFHFEISADLLDEEEIDLLNGLRPGLVQLEIGVQSTDGAVLGAIHRTADFEIIADKVRRIQKGRNVQSASGSYCPVFPMVHQRNSEVP